jgi:hypothetical protein
MTADMWQFSGGIAGAEGRPVLAPEGQEPNVYLTDIGPHGRAGGRRAAWSSSPTPSRPRPSTSW